MEEPSRAERLRTGGGYSDEYFEPEARFHADTALGLHDDEEPVEAELIDPDTEAAPWVTPSDSVNDDDIVDAELVEDEPRAIGGPSVTHALSAEPFAHVAEGPSSTSAPGDTAAESRDDAPGSPAGAVTPENAGRPDESVAGVRDAATDSSSTAVHREAAADEPSRHASTADNATTETNGSTAEPGPDATRPSDATTEPSHNAARPSDATTEPGHDATRLSDATTESGDASGRPDDSDAETTDTTAEATAAADGEPDEPVEDAADAATGTGDTTTETGEVDGADSVEGSADSDAYGETAEANDAAQAIVRSPAQPIRQRREQVADPRNRRTDPEQILAAYPVMFDPVTLRERIEDTDPMWVVIDRLTDKLEFAERDADRARLLSLRAVASRLLNDLDPALEDAREALRHAEATGDLVRVATVQARLAHVLQWRGEFAEADRIYAEAASPELPERLGAEIHELAGRSAFEQGRWLEAVNHLERALDLRKGADPDLVERIELALDTITGHAAEGWGPYPRTREEIVGDAQRVRPVRDEESGLLGYPGSLPPRFAQAQPFADGVAWVRRPEAQAWELIDEAGTLLIDASAGYRAAGRFAEGLAWVSRDDAGGWYAIDKQNRVIVPGGFDDARPFHRGLALVRRGGWGVIDRHTRTVVQPHYRAFATMLASGEPVDGFTEEGLAVVDAGEVYGVVDRAGHLLVQPVHAALLIHPAAFLVADRFGLWGALNRQGESMVELKFRERDDVLEEIDKLIKDTRPVL